MAFVQERIHRLIFQMSLRFNILLALHVFERDLLSMGGLVLS